MNSGQKAHSIAKSNPAHMMYLRSKKLPQLQKATQLILYISGQKSWLRCKMLPTSYVISQARKAHSIAKSYPAHMLYLRPEKLAQLQKSYPDLMYLRSEKLPRLHKQPSSICQVSKAALVANSNLSHIMYLRSEKLAQLQKATHLTLCMLGQKSWLNCKKQPSSIACISGQKSWLYSKKDPSSIGPLKSGLFQWGYRVQRI